MKLLISLECLMLLTTLLTAKQNISTLDHAIAWNGVTYNANSSLQYNLDKVALTKITFTGSERVLDLGCGDGAITALIATKVPQGSVIGSDCAHGMIEFAQSTYASQISNLSFTTSYIENITYKNEFDVVTSFCTLHWISDLPKAFSNIYTALKPGGRTLLFFPIAHDNIWYTQLADTVAQATWRNSFEKNKTFPINQQITNEYLRGLCKQTGFVAFDVHNGTTPYTFPTVDAFKSSFRGNTWFKAVPTKHQEEFLNDLVTRVLAYDKPIDNTCTIYHAFVTILATK